MIISMQQINSTIGDISGNLEKICEAIGRDKESNLFIFPELSLQGYMPYDFYLFEQSTKILDAIDIISYELRAHQFVVLGIALPHYELDADEKDFSSYSFELTGYHNVQNTVCVIGQNGLVWVQPKSLLPDYNVFVESRYFPYKLPEKNISKDKVCELDINGNSYRIGLLVCEDLWHSSLRNECIDSTDLFPIDILSKQSIDFVVCVSSSPYEHDKLHKRIFVARDAVQLIQAPLVFVNMVGANDEVVFDGSSFVMDKNKQVIAMLDFCKEDSFEISYSKNGLKKEQEQLYGGDTIDFINKPLPSIVDTEKSEKMLERICKVLELGLSDYINKTGVSRKIHLGLSGGIDSALTAVLAVRAVGKENVVGILLPSKYTSEESNRDALDLAKNLGISTYTLSINDLYTVAMGELSKVFEQSRKVQHTNTLAEENIQARARGLLLMAYSNKYNSTLLTTGNKSEIAVGYCTLYGDMCGSLNLIGDLYKTEVYALAKYLNKRYREKKEIIPQNIIDKEPSAELREDQKDRDSLPPYEILDKILCRFIEHHQSPEELIIQNFADMDTIKQVWFLYIRSEYKRYQAAPIIKLSSQSFGKGRIVPLAGNFSKY